MKKLVSFTTALFLFTACNSYMQIVTLESDNVKKYDSGVYSYVGDGIRVNYDLWSEGGRMAFTIINNTDDDIVFDKSNSFLIKNGYAFDYFKGRKYEYSSGSSITNKAQVGKEVTAVGVAAMTLGSVYSNAAYTGAVGTSRTLSGSVSSGITTNSGTAIEYQEFPQEIIPAHSAKSYCEYGIRDGVHRECGLARNPSKNEEAVKNYVLEDTPMIIENRLMFIVGNKVNLVTNTFYVNKIENMRKQKCVEPYREENCSGIVKVDDVIKVNKYQAPYRYYYGYVFDNGSTDRINIK